MKAIFLGLFCLVLIICGCKTNPPQNKQPTSAKLPASDAPAKPAVLRVEERSAEFYEKKPRAIAPDAFRERLDYKSQLTIKVDTNALVGRISQTSSVLPALMEEEKAQLNALSSLSDSARQYLKDFVQFAKWACSEKMDSEKSRFF